MRLNSELDRSSRNRIIVRTSLISIIANVFLSVFKTIIGIMTNSIAITLDAVNNITDAASSVITIVGAKLAVKAPDKKHPFGFGRIEYLSALIISAIVLYAGITSLVESVKKIINPEMPEYTTIALVIVGVGVVIKIVLGLHVRRVGERVDSDALVNSGKEATLDSAIAASTLVAAIIYLIWGISLEAYLAAIISVVIIKSGVEMIKETLDDILGQSTDPAFAEEIKETVCSFHDVKGAYDLVVHDYGPNTHQGSIHIEVRDDLTIVKLDELNRRIFDAVYEKHNVALTGISIYALNSIDPYTIEMKKRIEEELLNIEHLTEIHGFYLNKEKNRVRFDIVVSLDAKDRPEIYREALERVEAMYPDCSFEIIVDTDFAEV